MAAKKKSMPKKADAPGKGGVRKDVEPLKKIVRPNMRQAEEASKKKPLRADSKGRTGMGATKPRSTNKPGPVDDVVRGVSKAAGAVKRTVVSNPGNANKASNIDKWLKGGNYPHNGLVDISKSVVGGIGKTVSSISKGRKKK